VAERVGLGGRDRIQQKEIRSVLTYEV
jgi:hypothetical protein